MNNVTISPEAMKCLTTKYNLTPD